MLLLRILGDGNRRIFHQLFPNCGNPINYDVAKVENEISKSIELYKKYIYLERAFQTFFYYSKCIFGRLYLVEIKLLKV